MTSVVRIRPMNVCFVWYTGRDGKKRYLKDAGPITGSDRSGAEPPVWTDDLDDAKSMDEATAKQIARALPREDDMLDGFEVSPD
jgi:hypothetical protein